MALEGSSNRGSALAGPSSHPMWHRTLPGSQWRTKAEQLDGVTLYRPAAHATRAPQVLVVVGWGPNRL